MLYCNAVVKKINIKKNNCPSPPPKKQKHVDFKFSAHDALLE
jgi:hypothetical protein